MPVNTDSKPGRQAVMIALGLIGSLGVLAFALDRISSGGSNSVTLEIGRDEILLANADDQAELVDEFGPSLFPDVTGGDGNFFLSHVGESSQTGWFAILQVQPTEDNASCEIAYNAVTDSFVNCDQEQFGLDGEGLEQFAVRVADGQLLVDIDAL